MRDVFGVTDYKSFATRIKAGRKEFQDLIATRNQVNTANEEIPIKDLSKQTDVQKSVSATNMVETSLHTLLDLPEVKSARTQTERLNFRKLQGLDEALQRKRGELTNNLAKLAKLDKDIAKENRKLQEVKDEIRRGDIKARLENLGDKSTSRLEAASANKEALRGQINKMKETIDKVLKVDVLR